MNRILVDADLKLKLHDFSEPLELCDASGRVVAHVVPVVAITDCEPLTAEISDEELDRRAALRENRYTTRQVLDHLERL